ncbi:uncharacterized protein LOC126266571 [Aethina tumida]|uniref:uncharacterized protein LOC126266571 n=1 Tax=Aethina tumida TaxID=116153 RepID=UPI0021486B8F|nr:uncharacterized protein LOC126266571 [Aethina tumida]
MSDSDLVLQQERLKKITDELILQLTILEALPYLTSTDGLATVKEKVDENLFQTIINTIEDFKGNKITNVKKFKEKVCIICNATKLKFLEGNTQCMKNDTISMITEYLKNIFDKKLGRSGVEDLNHKQVFFEIYKNNKYYLEFINDVKNKLKGQDEDFKYFIEQQTSKRNKYERGIIEMKEHFNRDILEICQRSTFTLKEDIKIWEEQIRKLQKEAREVRLAYNHHLETHMENEKKLRIQRKNVEDKLVALINKFDVSVGNMFNQYELLQERYQKLQIEVEELIQKDALQKKLYDKLMKEKRIEEENLRNELVTQFVLNRCAVTIQRQWREFTIRRHAKKKKKVKSKAQSGDKKTAEIKT